MELICPSCEARYQVPDSSIGEKGRQVSCMSCGHSWHAFPPLVLGSSAAPPTTASAGIDFQTPPRPGRSSAAFPPTEAETPPARPPEAPRPPDPPRTSDASRSEQLAEIREMLAEVQSEERAAAAMTPDDDYRARESAPDPEPKSARGEPGAGASESRSPAAAPTLRPASTAPEESGDEDDEDDETDPLRRRMAMHDRDKVRKRTDVEKLRKRHDRRVRRQQRAGEVRSGAFLTGFLLIVMIAAVMTAIYMLQPQIVSRMPGTGPMLDEYVSTVDGLRVEVAEGFESARDWLTRMLGGNA